MLSLKVLTPKGVLLTQENVSSITLPTKKGVISIYNNHEPLISLLSVGEIEINLEKENKYLYISSGLLRVERDNNIYIMADTSEFSDQIDIEQATEAKRKAEEFLKNNKDIPEVEFVRIQSNIERELARIEIGKLRNKSKQSVQVKVTKK